MGSVRMPHRLLMASWLIALSVSGQARAQNLVVNSDFDGNLDGWTIEGGGFVYHDPATGSPAAPLGSALLTLSAVNQVVYVSLSQCFQVAEGPFDFGGRFDMDGSINCTPSISLYFFNSSNCEATAQSVVGALPAPNVP